MPPPHTHLWRRPWPTENCWLAGGCFIFVLCVEKCCVCTHGKSMELLTGEILAIMSKDMTYIFVIKLHILMRHKFLRFVRSVLVNDS